jgi:hypothetical protein
MPLINQPPSNAVDTLDGKGNLMPPSEGWRNFFSSVFSICNELTMSGTTLQRPLQGLWTGRMYFDTDLGKPIWYKTAGWVDATGASV